MKKKLQLGQVMKGLNIQKIDMQPFVRYYLGELAFDQLTLMQQEKLIRYKTIWSLLCKGDTNSDIVDLLQRDYDIEIRQAYEDIKAANKLFGSIEEVDKQGRRIASMHFFDLMAKKAHDEGDFETAIKARQAADNLSGINKEEEEGWDPKVWLKPSKTQYVVKVDNHFYNSQPQKVYELDE